MNYKPRPRPVTIAGYKIYLPETAEYLQLFDRTTGASAAESMQKDGGTLYAVGTGKTFHALGMRIIVAGTTGGNIVIYSGDTEDALTTALHTFDVPKIDLMIYDIPFSSNNLKSLMVWSAGKFIVIKPSSTTIKFLEIYGYEI